MCWYEIHDSVADAMSAAKASSSGGSSACACKRQLRGSNTLHSATTVIRMRTDIAV